MTDNLLFFSLLGTSFVLGMITCFLTYRLRKGSFNLIAKEIIQEAENQAEHLKQSLKSKRQEQELNLARELEEQRRLEGKKLIHEEERIKQREDKLELHRELLEKKLTDIEKGNSNSFIKNSSLSRLNNKLMKHT